MHCTYIPLKMVSADAMHAVSLDSSPVLFFIAIAILIGCTIVVTRRIGLGWRLACSVWLSTE